MTQQEYDMNRLFDEIWELKAVLRRWYEIRDYLLTPYALVHETESRLGLPLTDFTKQEKEMEQ